jgi:KipI family sensor histidine kinase inhibitor
MRCIILISKGMEIVPASDRALLVRLSDHETVIAFANALETSSVAGVTSFSPAYTSVLVRYDPCVADAESLASGLSSLGRAGNATEHRDLALPVTFDGPDLEELAHARDLSLDAVVDIFCERVYRVYFLGFVPGFAYLGDVDERIAAPRRVTPRNSVPPGSVGIAGRQTAIYPLQTPGGWNLIGRCAIPVFTPDRHPPCLLRPGDRVRFHRI